MTKGYIFDYGGTLDTCGQHWGMALWHAYERRQVPVSEPQFREAYVHVERTLGAGDIIQPGYTFRQTLETKVRMQMAYLRSQAEGSHIDERQAERLAEAVVDDLYARTQACTTESRRVLLRLREHYPLVLVSNFYGNIGTVLREFALDDLFQTVIESATVGIRKPDPRIFLLGAEALGLQPREVTVVGDSLKNDIIPAREAGCHTVWLRGEGWDDRRQGKAHDGQPEGADKAGRIIGRLDELTSE